MKKKVVKRVSSKLEGNLKKLAAIGLIAVMLFGFNVIHYKILNMYNYFEKSNTMQVSDELFSQYVNDYYSLTADDVLLELKDCIEEYKSYNDEISYFKKNEISIFDCNMIYSSRIDFVIDVHYVLHSYEKEDNGFKEFIGYLNFLKESIDNDSLLVDNNFNKSLNDLGKKK